MARAIPAKYMSLAIGLLVVAVLSAGAAASAQAQFRLESFSAGTMDEAGRVETQAGVHPYSATTSFSFNTMLQDTMFGPNTIEYPVEHAKNAVVDLPAGFVGDLTALPTCSRYDLTRSGLGRCPVDSQVGVVTLKLSNGIIGPPQDYTTGVYNVVPEVGEIADLGFIVNSVPVHIRLSVAPDNAYRVRAAISDISTALPVVSSKVTLWGVPADSSHAPQRGPGFRCDGTDGSDPSLCDPGGGYASSATQRPFLAGPTLCGVPAVTGIRVDTWEHPGDWIAATTSSPASTGCDSLAFDPSLKAHPSTTQADAPTGLNVDLGFPQDGLREPEGLRAADLRTATVTLPEGMTINPASAAGLQACTDAQLGLGTNQTVACPDASKIGTVQATTPLLAEGLTGQLYLRPQASDDPASGEMFRIALVLANEQRGLSVRLPGSIKADPTTGRLTTTFEDNPQLPVDMLSLQLKSGARAPLATPPTCGEKTVNAELTSWSGEVVDRRSTFTIDCSSGLGGFAPSFTAGTTSPAAGAFSPIVLDIAKPDGDADIDGLSISLPPGLLAKLKGNLGTQVGTVTAFAGPGSNPFALPGKVYLEGAYGDAPFSLRVVVPAKAGPFDLGTVEVRQKIYVDPIDAHVTVVSDPVPTIVSGVPVRLQRLDVNVDKAGFIINPTSCTTKEIRGDLHSVAGTTAALSVRFQVGGCSDLALAPTLGLTLSGKGQTTDGKHPAVTAYLTQPAGQANLKKVRVALPLSLALDPDNANGLCEFVDGSKLTPTCPKASIVGTATAVTPILDEPLSGPVYFVKNIRKDPKSGRGIRTLPKLVIPLVGQNGVKLTLTGTSDAEDDQLVTTFDNIPDAPVSSFKLSIIGGKGGILTVSGTDICKATQVVDQQIDGQNNQNADTDVYIQTPSCPLTVLSKKIGKSSVALKVGGLGAGKVTVTGRGIRKTTRTITKSTVATITAKRTKGTPGKFKVSFLPKGLKKVKTASAR